MMALTWIPPFFPADPCWRLAKHVLRPLGLPARRNSGMGKLLCAQLLLRYEDVTVVIQMHLLSLYYSKARATSQNNWGCKGLLEVIWTSGGPSGHVDLLKQDIWRCLTRTTRLLSLSAGKSLEMSPGAISPQWLWEMKMEKSLRSSCWWLSGAGWLSKTTRLMFCPRGDEGWLSKEHMLPGLLTTRWLSAVQDLLLTSFLSKAMFVFPPSPSNL